MGWWNEQIYGGDPAIEWKENIYSLCKVKEYGDDRKPQSIPRDVIKDKIVEIQEMVSGADTDEEDRNIGYQVLGAILMHSGFDISSVDGLKKKIIESASNDVWAQNNVVRMNVMKNFKKTVNEYDFSEPIDINDVNMLEESEEDEEEEIVKEFKEVFSIIDGRLRKIKQSAEEKSGNEDFDEGYQAAVSESEDFLKELKELMSRQEMLGVLLERISKGRIESSPSYSNSEGMVKESSMSSGARPGGDDVMAG